MSWELVCLIASRRAMRHRDLADVRVVVPLVLQVFRHDGELESGELEDCFIFL